MHEIISMNHIHFRIHSQYVSSCSFAFCPFDNCRNDGLGDGCAILNWDYKHLSSMSYTDAISYTQSQQRPDTISCFDNPNYSFHFDQAPGASIVQEVCVTSVCGLKEKTKAKPIFSAIFIFQLACVCSGI